MSAISRLVLILFAALALASCSEPSGRLSVELRDEVSGFVDPEGTLSVEEIDAGRGHLFRPGRPAAAAAPLHARSWMRIDGKALSELIGPDWHEPVVLMLDDNRIRQAQFALVGSPDGRTQTWKRYNEKSDDAAKGFRYPVFLVNPSELDEDRLYLSYRADGPVRGTLRIADFQSFAALYDGGTRLLTLLLGVRIAVFAYILALGLSLQSRTNLWLAALIGIGLLQVVADNALFETASLPGGAALARAATLAMLFGSHLCLVGFATRFLRLHARAPSLFTVSVVLLRIQLVLIAAAVVDGLADLGLVRPLVPYARLAVLLFIAAAAAAAARRSPYRAVSFFLAWTPVMGAVGLRVLQDFVPAWAPDEIPNSAYLASVTVSLTLFAILSSVDVQRRESRLKANVRHNAERFKAFAEIGTDASWEVDGAGRISFVAGRSAPLPWLRLGDSLVSVVERASSPEAAAPLRAALARRAAFDDIRLRLSEARDGEHWISLSGRPIEDSAHRRLGGSVYRGLIRDVTEEVEREGRRLIEQQVFALGQLAGSIAHEINNLIHPVLNLTKRLRARQKKNEDAESERMLDLIDLSSRQAAKVVSELLQTMRGNRSMEIERPLPNALEQALEGIRPALPSSVSIALLCEDGPWPSVRVGDMLQVLGNLVSNAVHAMEGRGAIRIVLSKVERGARLVVSDDGHGMEERVRLRALQPFFSTKTDGKGTGVGLYIVQRIVGDYKGWVAVDSSPGEGTSVTIFIPNPGDPDAD